MVALWCAANLINYKDNRFTAILVGLSGASFGIYIFHNWIEMYMVSSSSRHIFPIDHLAMEYTVLFPLVFSCTAFIISYGLSYCLLRTKVGKRLIG